MGSKVVSGPGLLLLLVSSSLAQPVPSKAQQIETHTRQAAEYLKNNRADMAASEFRAIVELAPEDLDAQSNLGVLLFFSGDFAQAAPHLRAAVKLQPALSRIQALLGMCEKRNGESALAEADLRAAFPQLQDERLKVQAGLELVEICYGRDEPEKATEIVATLRTLRPDDPDVLYVAYRIYAALARESALGLATAAPTSARMQQVMAQELARQGKYQEAIAHYRESLKTDPHLTGAHFELAEMLNVTGDAEAAAKEYQAALGDNPFDAKSESRLGELAFRATELTAASEHFSRALHLQPDDVDTCVGLAKVLIATSQPEKALPLLERSVKADPFDAAIHYQLGLVYRSLGRAAEARREMEEFSKSKESNAQLKQLYRQMGLQPNPGRPEPDTDK